MHNSAAISSTASDCWRTVVDLVQARALHQPDRTAYRFLKNGEQETLSVTYQELALKARAYGAYLSAIGLTGRPALLLFPSGAEFITAFFGCLYAGAIAIPAYPPRNARGLPRILAMIKDASPAAVLTTAASVGKMQSLFADAHTTRTLRYVATDTISDEWANDWEASGIDKNTLAFLQYP
jgi:acyl-CoA synthetase (AMP-forming)/AMP-acid ligase II